MGAVAVTQACCEPVLQSTTEQWGMHLAQTEIQADHAKTRVHAELFNTSSANLFSKKATSLTEQSCHPQQRPSMHTPDAA